MCFREEPSPRCLAGCGGARHRLVHEPFVGRPGPWDFDDPAIPTTERDTAATAIAAAALLKLAQVGPEDRRVRYRDFAEVTVEALTARRLTVDKGYNCIYNEVK